MIFPVYSIWIERYGKYGTIGSKLHGEWNHLLYSLAPGQYHREGLKNILLGNDEINKKFWELYSIYSEKERYYHNVGHIAYSLNFLREAKHLAEKPIEIGVAIFGHDIICNPKKKANEELSAKYMKEFLTKIKVSEDSIRRVNSLIMATAHNFSNSPNSIDEMIIRDIDLLIFGESKEKFDEYERNIRREYNFLNETEFRKGRKSVIEKFLLRERIYYTKFFGERYEKKARTNLERSLSKLDI